MIRIVDSGRTIWVVVYYLPALNIAIHYIFELFLALKWLILNFLEVSRITQEFLEVRIAAILFTFKIFGQLYAGVFILFCCFYNFFALHGT